MQEEKEIRRNARCPCGSGERYKHCHGKLTGPMFREVPQSKVPPEVMRLFRARMAEEQVRQQQQGYGRPIISWEDAEHGYRFVVVGEEVSCSKKWVIFPDFLMYFMKEKMKREWGEKESKNPDSQHPLFRWLQKSEAYRKANSGGDGLLKSVPMLGFDACILHLAYSLYLIDHHDQLTKLLMKRLREPRNFLPAYYETLAGAAFAVAGFKIEWAETKSTSPVATPEFSAVSKSSGKRYNVEAKRKDSWKAPTDDIDAPAFHQELSKYLCNRLYDASRKGLENSVFWIELSIPSLVTREAWVKIAGTVSSIVRDAEQRMKIGGKPAGPAYIAVTNCAFLTNEEVAGAPFFAVLETFNIPDFIPVGRPADPEEVLAAYDRHRDIMHMMECLEIMAIIPTTFDGSPGELLDKNGRAMPTLKIGERIAYPDQDGVQREGVIEDIASCGEQAYAVVQDEAIQKRNIISVPLTTDERRAVARYGDAIFGKDNAPKNIPDGDILALYDRMLEMHGRFSREQLIKQLEGHPRLQEYEQLGDRELRIRVCREMTKNVYARSLRDHKPQKFDKAKEEA